MDSWRSSKQPDKEQQVYGAPMLLPPLSIFTFFTKPPKPNLHLLDMAVAASSTAVQQLQDSVSSIADKYLKLLHSFASQNPFLNNFLLFSSHIQSFSKNPRQKYKSLDSLSNHSFAAVLPGDSVAGIVVANGILNFLNIYNTLLVVRLVLTWFPNAPPAVVSPLSTICDPYLNIFRGLIPPLGGTLDLSPILAFLVLNAFTSTAAALPAELPPEGVPEKTQSQNIVSDLTTSQKKWMRRLTKEK